MSPDSDVWLPMVRRDPRARLRLFCFPYAGGGASLYRSWVERLPAEIEVRPVQLPGRESRLDEPPRRTMAPLVADIVNALRGRLDAPYALFGHSLGALVAFEVARAVRRARLPAPGLLFVSAFRAPHLPDAAPPVHQLPGHAFREELARLNGTPAEALQSDELMGFLEPTLRADFALHETYAYTPEEALACPISAFGGHADREVSHDMLAEWRGHTRGPFVLRMLPGDHFFIHASRAALLEAVAEDIHSLVIRRAVDARGGGSLPPR